MKKVAFAIQVFSLVAFLPSYLIVELNHETESIQVKISSRDFIGTKEKTNTPAPVLIDLVTHFPLFIVE